VRLPRDLSGRALARSLELPDHAALRVGTLSAIVTEVAMHHGMERDELVTRLFG